MKHRLLVPALLTAAFLIIVVGSQLVRASSSAQHTTTHTALVTPCSTLSGAELQECTLYTTPTPNSADFPATGALFAQALDIAADCHVILGIPLYKVATVDWSGNAITDNAFSSGLRAEYHADEIVRFYDQANQRLCSTT